MKILCLVLLDEGNAFLFVGLKPPLGEPILSIMGWGPEFPKHIIGLTHMKRGKTEIHGLPNDAKVYLSLFNYDNNAGTGGAVADTGRDHVATIPIYATWSNGYHKTPEHMAPLVDFIEKGKKSLAEIVRPDAADEFKLPSGRVDQRKLNTWMKDHATEEVEVEGLGKVRIIDVLAASSYLRIRRSHEARAAQNAKNK